MNAIFAGSSRENGPNLLFCTVRVDAIPAHKGTWLRSRFDSRQCYNGSMAQDNEITPDPNINAARIVGEATASSGLTGDLETAWAEWSGSIQNVDERGMTLLRAAFEAGYEAGQSSS